MGGENNQVKWRGVQPVAGIRGIWPAVDAERKIIEQYQSGVGTVVMYTVGAGKLLFISTASLTTRCSGAAAHYVWIVIRNAGDVVQVHVITQYYSVADQITTVIHFTPALEVPAGYDITLDVGNGPFVSRAGVYGWEEDE